VDVDESDVGAEATKDQLLGDVDRVDHHSEPDERLLVPVSSPPPTVTVAAVNGSPRPARSSFVPSRLLDRFIVPHPTVGAGA